MNPVNRTLHGKSARCRAIRYATVIQESANVFPVPGGPRMSPSLCAARLLHACSCAAPRRRPIRLLNGSAISSRAEIHILPDCSLIARCELRGTCGEIRVHRLERSLRDLISCDMNRRKSSILGVFGSVNISSKNQSAFGLAADQRFTMLLEFGMPGIVTLTVAFPVSSRTSSIRTM